MCAERAFGRERCLYISHPTHVDSMRHSHRTWTKSSPCPIFLPTTHLLLPELHAGRDAGELDQSSHRNFCTFMIRELAIPSARRYHGDATCKPTSVVRDEALLNATNSLADRLAQLYMNAGHQAPVKGPYGISLPDLATGGGASMWDLELFVRLAQLPQLAAQRDLRIFCIGNAFGYSTIALALVFPRARIAALDAHETQTGRDVSTGTNLTRTIAHAAKLNLRVHVGASPFDVAEVLIHEGMASSSGGIDIAFIDGAHTDAQQYADYAAVRTHMRRGAGLSTVRRGCRARIFEILKSRKMVSV